MRFDARRATRCRRVAALAATVVLGAVVASLAAVTCLGLTFPDQVAGATLGPVTDFEKDKPGLGYGIRYQLQGWSIDIYIYNDAINPIPDDLSSDVIKAQLAQAQGDIFERQKRGTASDIKLTGSRDITDARGRLRFLCRDYTFIDQSQRALDSFLCLTGWHNEFIKFRLTTLRHSGSDAEARRLVQAWLGILWP